MANSVEETVDLEVFLLTSHDVLDAQAVKEVTVSQALGSHSVPEDGLRRSVKILCG